MLPTWYYLVEGSNGVRLVGTGTTSLRELVKQVRRASLDDDPRAKLRRVGRGAYEYSSQRTRDRGERLYFYTWAGIDALRRPGAKRCELVPAGAKWGPSPLRKELRAQCSKRVGSPSASAS